MTTLGKYELHEQLGKGGFGTVYRATDTSLNRVVALKVLHPQLMMDEEFIERFKREAQLLAALDNRHMVTIYNVDEIDGRVVIVMRYLPGGNLRQLIDKNGPLTFQKAAQILLQTLDGLKEAHKKGLIHRDLKPENILLDAQGEAVITDLGLARQTNESQVYSSTEILGTPNYIAPEIWTGQPATPASDVYSLGCILYELLTATLLFDGDTPGYVMTQHLVEGPQLTDSFLPPERTLLESALARDPAYRYRNADEFARALKDLIHFPAEVPRPPAPPPAPPVKHAPPVSYTPVAAPAPAPAAKNPLPWVLLGVCIVAGAVIIALVSLLNRGSVNQTTQGYGDAPVVAQEAQAVYNENNSPPANAPVSAAQVANPAQAPTNSPTKINPTITPTVFQCPGMPPSRVKVGDKVVICTIERLTLRASPAKNGEVHRLFDPGTKLKIIGGPVCADGSTWWEVFYDDSKKPDNLTDSGWVKEGTDEKMKYFLELDKDASK